MAKKALAAYREKRDFSKTAEPSGERAVAASSRLRFVVQKHAARRLHYDLRLELDGVFKSWAVTRGPSDDPADKRLAVEVEDHPLDYGDFEGTIPAGEYGGGTVQLWDRGYWAPEGAKPPEEALRAGDFKFTLDGERLHGSWVLVRMKNDRSGGKRTNWLLIKHRDASARSDGGAALLADDRSVASGRTDGADCGREGARTEALHAVFRQGRSRGCRLAFEAEHARRSARDRREARGRTEKASLLRAAGSARAADSRFRRAAAGPAGGAPSSEPGWGHEVKFDGYRLQLRVVNGKAALRTRNALDWTPRFSAIAAEAEGLPDCLIDGEVVALDERRVPSFCRIASGAVGGQDRAIWFFLRSICCSRRARILRALPLAERKARLEQLLQREPGEHIRYVQHLESRGDAVLASACKMGLEGIVSKSLDAPYSSGRGDSGGKRNAAPATRSFSAAGPTSRARFDRCSRASTADGHLVYVGRIGTGYTREIAEELAAATQGADHGQESVRRRQCPAEGKATCAGSSPSWWPRSSSPDGRDPA